MVISSIDDSLELLREASHQQWQQMLSCQTIYGYIILRHICRYCLFLFTCIWLSSMVITPLMVSHILYFSILSVYLWLLRHYDTQHLWLLLIFAHLHLVLHWLLHHSWIYTSYISLFWALKQRIFLGKKELGHKTLSSL